MNERHILWLWLKIALQDRPLIIYKYYDYFKDIEKIYNCTEDDLAKVPFEIKDDVKAALLNKNTTEALKMHRVCEGNNISIVAIDDDNYPALLKEISSPPCTLFFYGNLDEAISKPCFTIVGTRKCTTYGQVITSAISGYLARAGFTIVCGVANGIDTYALDAAVKSEGSVIAVAPSGLGSLGFNVKYKFKNLRYNGVVISEYLPITPTSKYCYYERNRILSGISEGCLVTQAPEKSGALITAHNALDQGRDVFAVVANVDMEQSRGSNMLIKDGAIPVFNAKDIIDYYAPKFGFSPESFNEYDISKEYIYKERLVDRHHKVNDFMSSFKNKLNDRQLEVAMEIREAEVTVDYLVDRLPYPISEVLAILSELEAMGVVTAIPGNIYKISI